MKKAPTLQEIVLPFIPSSSQPLHTLIPTIRPPLPHPATHPPIHLFSNPPYPIKPSNDMCKHCSAFVTPIIFNAQMPPLIAQMNRNCPQLSGSVPCTLPLGPHMQLPNGTNASSPTNASIKVTGANPHHLQMNLKTGVFVRTCNYPPQQW